MAPLIATKSAEELEEMPWNDVRALAKQHNIKASGSKSEIIEQLVQAFEESMPRTASRSSKRIASNAAPPPLPSRTKPSTTRAVTNEAGPSTNANSTRTRSRVVSSANPRAALTRTRSRNNNADESEDEVKEVIPLPVKKAKETQKRLGVGRPKAAGGTGVRKSTARGKQIVEVLVPSLAMVREEAAASAVSRKAREGVAGPSGANASPAKQRESSPEEEVVASVRPAGDQTLAQLTDRLDKTDAALADERRKVAKLEDTVTKLEAEVTTLKTELFGRIDTFETLLSELQKQNEKAAQGPAIPTAPITPPPAPEPTNPVDESPFPPTPPSFISNQGPTVSRPASRPTSRAASPFIGGSGQTLLKTATAGRARAMSNQPSNNPVPLPAFALGKHAREVREGSVASDASAAFASPKKKRRVDEGDQEMELDGERSPAPMEVEPEATVEADVEGASSTQNKGKAPARSTPADPQPVPPAPTAGRASSQPSRSVRSGPRAGSETPVSNVAPRRNTRAGSAGPVPGTSRTVGRNTGLETVREAESGSSTQPAFTSNIQARPAAAARPSMSRNLIPPSYPVILEPGSRTFTPQELLSLEITQRPPTPPRREPSRERFITYPLPGDPVKELKPLTHFDSGSEFLGTESKQGYKTDWHEGTVFDDPWDAETIERRRRLVAEGGQPPPGPIDPPPEQVEAFEELALGGIVVEQTSTLSPPSPYSGPFDGMEMSASMYN